MSSASSISDDLKVSSDDVLGRIIYLSPTTHPDSAEPIIIFSLAALATVPETLSDEDLFAGLLERCKPWVGEEGGKGYVLVILASEEQVTTRGRGRGFWIWRWRHIPRSFRKNLKRMYIVHPTRFTRTILQMVLPFLSPKSYRKIYPLESLILLHRSHQVSLAGMHLSLPLLEDESRVIAERQDLFPSAHKRAYAAAPAARGWFSGLQDMMGMAASYLPYGATPALPLPELAGQGCYGRTAEDLVQAYGGVPMVMDQMREAILGECSKVEGIFRGTPGAMLRPPLIAMLDLPPQSQPTFPWSDIARYDPFLPPKLLMRIVSSSPAPYIPSDIYPVIRGIRASSDIPIHLFPALSPARLVILSPIIHTLHLLSVSHEQTTRMTALNYAICFAPDLIRGEDPIEDLEICLVPGKRLPPALSAQRKGTGGDEEDSSLVGVLEMWIRDYAQIERATSRDG